MPFDNERLMRSIAGRHSPAQQSGQTKLIENCHAQLEPYGLMVFTALSIYDKTIW